MNDDITKKANTDPLADPIAAPVSLRSRTVPERLRRMRDLIADARSQGVVHPALDVLDAGLECEAIAAAPPTLRDLIQAARDAGLKLRRQAAGVWAYSPSDALHRTYVHIDHMVSQTWRVTVYSRNYGSHVMLLAPTIADIAAAARLCGWEVGTS